MEKRVILAVLISIAVLFIYNLYFYRAVEKSTPPVPSRPLLTAPAPVPAPTTPARPIKTSLVIPEQELFIKTDPLTIQLTPQGEIGSLRLNRFKEKDSDLGVDLIRKDSSVHPLEITLAKTRIIPSGFRSLSDRDKEFIYQISTPQKIEIRKKLSFDEETYLIRVDLEISNPSQENLVLEDLGLGWRGGRANISAGGGFGETSQLYLSSKKSKKISYKGIGMLERTATFLGLAPKREPRAEEFEVEGDISWIAQKERYFLTVLVPEGGIRQAFFRKTKDSFLEMGLVVPQFLVPPLGRKVVSFKVYAGPSDYAELKTLYPGAEKLAGLNILSLLTLRTLRLLYRFTRNYGLAIILLAIIIRIILYPLTHTSLKSMKNMQKLTPEMDKLKRKHKDDKEQLNREMLALYKRHKVNPMSGCLPLLVQLPFLYAIFTTLQTAIDLRGTPFILWVKDLSDKDPYYVLPVLMGISMFVQQKMSTKDPQQAKAMAFMSFIFTFTFMGFPSGLVLYWLFQNVLSIGQQYLVNRSK